MFERLIASAPAGRRSAVQAMVSVVVHGALAGAALHATTTLATPQPGPAADTLIWRIPIAADPVEPGMMRSGGGVTPIERAPTTETLRPPDIDRLPALPPIDTPAPAAGRTTDPRAHARGGVGGDLATLGGGEPGRDTTQVFAAGDLDHPIEVLEQPMPVYPPALRSAGITGQVDLEFVVGRDGRVEPATLVVRASTHSAFTERARAAVLSTRFRPARWRDHAVRQLVRQRVRFDTQSGSP